MVVKEDAAELLAWFDRHRRDLPWRRTTDPYRIWVSEVMLQQTRVEAVLPFYERFLARFGSVEELARAPLAEVLALWSGLGYYRRARQLHAAAAQVVAAGGFPRTVAGLLALPGIGAYTAAAVASIAFGVAAPVLDGNVERVMARRLALDADPKRRDARARLLAAAAALVDPARPGDSNQALMELGATLCVPQRPRCLLCPVRRGCLAAASGTQESYPPPRKRRAGEIRRLLVAVARRQGSVLLFRRSERSSLLAGTWELPWIDRQDDTVEPAAALAAKYGGGWRLAAPIGQVRHGITYRNLEVTVHLAEQLASGDAATAGKASWPASRHGHEADEVAEAVAGGWFAADELAGLATSSLVTKVLALVNGADPGGSAAATGGGVRRRGRPASRLPSRRPG
jgi:A/G-specific adenine glycosylase